MLGFKLDFWDYLTFASLAASVLMPPEYGVPLPQPEELPVAMGAVVREFRAHPAGEHALAMFRDERRFSRQQPQQPRRAKERPGYA